MKKTRTAKLEKGLIAHVLRKFSSDAADNADIGRRIVGVISSIVGREHYQNSVLARIWTAVQLWSADAEGSSLAAELFEMFRFLGDEAAAAALIDISSAPYPGTTQEAVATALEIRDRMAYLQEVRLEQEARGLWIDEECERGDIPVPPDDDVEW
jgi:hypothetical protein